MDLKEIKAVIDLMTRNGLSEFELEKGDFKLRVRRGTGGEWSTSSSGANAPQVVHHHAPVAAVVAPTAAAPTPQPQLAATSTTATVPGAESKPVQAQILSPMVGTFYLSPAPDAPAFISIGQEVNDETIVGIIEAMKVMNEIKAEMSGIIVEVLAENGKSVEYGKPLFAVRPA